MSQFLHVDHNDDDGDAAKAIEISRVFSENSRANMRNILARRKQAVLSFRLLALSASYLGQSNSRSDCTECAV